MAHYFIHEDGIGAPFQSIREMKMIIPGGAERRQVSSHPKIVFVLNGECSVRMMDGFHAHLKRGDALIFPRPCHHYYGSAAPERDAELYTFGLFFKPLLQPRKRPSRFDADWSHLTTDLFSKNRHFQGIIDSTIQTLINTFREEYYSRKIGSLAKQTAICQEIVIELARRISEVEAPQADPENAHSKASIAMGVKDFLAQTLPRKHSLPEIAWRFHLSEEHLARIFKKETGTSVMAYLRAIRIASARTLLLSTTETVAALAAQLGFTSGNHFCRVFTQQTGQSPTEYRRRHAGSNHPEDFKKPH